jgi:hypothetical protein
LPHVGPDVLAQRLRDLEQSGLVRRGTLPPPAGSRIYELTQRGRELEPVVLALGRFGSVAPFPPGEAEIGVDAVVIALKSLFAPSAPRARRPATSCAWASSASASTWPTGASRSPRGSAPAPDAAIETDPATLASVLWHGRKLDEARRAGALAIEGDRTAVARLLALFPLPAS